MSTGMGAPLDLSDLRQVFVDESYDGLDAIVAALLSLTPDTDHTDVRAAIFRVAHNIKGGAPVVGFPAVAEYAHLFEDALELLRSDVAPITTAQVTLLLHASDALRGMIADEAAGRTVSITEKDRVALAKLAASVSESAAVDETFIASPDHASMATSTAMRALRVDMEKLDTMLMLNGEIAVAKQRLHQRLVTGASRDDALAASEELDRALSELQERVMQLRLVSLGTVFRPLARTVRDVAAAQGKSVQLVTEGEDIEVDASIVQQLRDPLVHMVRNAVDHGIESRAERELAGKPVTATIRIRAVHERGAVVISVKDDGAGLRRDRIRSTAIARGLISADATLTDDELDALIFQPGFSTAASITSVSGRGVGMDIVRANVESLRGALSVRSVPGAGTSVSIRVPLTIAIIEGFVVDVANERYVIPSDVVCECLMMPPLEASNDRCGVLYVRGTAMPYARLGSLFGTTSHAAARENLVIVSHDGRQFGLVVDALIGEYQAVLKPLHRIFDRVPGVSGSTILGDGRVSLILDVPHLFSMLSQCA